MRAGSWDAEQSTAQDGEGSQWPLRAHGAKTAKHDVGVGGETAPSILLIGFFGRGNFGDDLMCSSLADYLMRDGRYRVTIATSDTNAYGSLAEKGCCIIPRNFRNVFLVLSRAQILCQGGGTIFHDSYKGKYLLRYWLNLMQWTLLFWIARMKDVQVIIVGAGVGPFRHRLSRWIARVAFAACTAIGIRDQASVEELKKLRTRAPYEVGFDLAALAAPAGARACAAESSTHGPKVLGISACSLTPFLGDARVNEQYWQTMGDALARFTQENPVRLMFFSLFTGESSESDDTVTDIIVSRLPASLVYERHSYRGDVEDYGALFDHCDWFLGSKFHGALAAYLSGCECAIVSYNRKMTDLADEIGLAAERRVAANKLQSMEVWLDVLRSFSPPRNFAGMLDRTEGRRRAQQGVEAVLERVRVTGLLREANGHGR